MPENERSNRTVKESLQPRVAAALWLCYPALDRCATPPKACGLTRRFGNSPLFNRTCHPSSHYEPGNSVEFGATVFNGQGNFPRLTTTDSQTLGVITLANLKRSESRTNLLELAHHPISTEIALITAGAQWCDLAIVDWLDYKELGPNARKENDKNRGDSA